MITSADRAKNNKKHRLPWESKIVKQGAGIVASNMRPDLRLCIEDMSYVEEFSFERQMESAFALVLHFYPLWLASKTSAAFINNGKQNNNQSRFARAFFPRLVPCCM